eukprot:SAG11_NODE_25305_length_360_cov_1.969349_1_plen_63_part_10
MPTQSGGGVKPKRGDALSAPPRSGASPSRAIAAQRTAAARRKAEAAGRSASHATAHKRRAEKK